MRFLTLAVSLFATVAQARIGEGPDGDNRHLELSGALKDGVQEVTDQIDENEKNITEIAAKIEANKNATEQNTLGINANEIAIETNALDSEVNKNSTEKNELDIKANMNEIELDKQDIIDLIANYSQLRLEFQDLLARVEELEPVTTTEDPLGPPPSTPANCPGYAFSIGSNEYCYSNEELNWYEHEAQAQGLGGNLASIRTKDVNDAIHEKILGFGGNLGYFLGGTILSENFNGCNYKVEWVDGTAASGCDDFDWNPWAGSHPNSKGPLKVIVAWKSNGKWASIDKTRDRFAVYEM